MTTKCFDSMIRLRFGKTKVAKKKKEFNGKWKPIKIYDVDVDAIIISKLIETKINSKYLIRYFDDAIRALVLILPKVWRYVKTC